MPLCPRCGAAHHREDEVCRECGKRLLTRPQVAADQTSLSFPTCVDGPDGCEGPPVERADGRLRCTAHHAVNQFTVPSIPGPKRPACLDGPRDCHGPVTPDAEGRFRCTYHQELRVQPRWRAVLKRWFRLG